jgi:hypothetical protein
MREMGKESTGKRSLSSTAHRTADNDSFDLLSPLKS